MPHEANGQGGGGGGGVAMKASHSKEPDFSEGVAIAEEVHCGANYEPLRIGRERRQLHAVQKEYYAVVKEPIEGLYVTVSAREPLVWFGLLIVRVGTFCGGMFRFTLTLASDFPDNTQLPSIRFDDTLFHPMIDPSSRLVDLGRFFPSGWQQGRNHVYQLLTATQSIFFRSASWGKMGLDVATAANPDAAKMVAEQPARFKQLAREVVRHSRTQIYDPPNTDDPNAIRFSPWNEPEMEPIRLFILGKSDTLPASYRRKFDRAYTSTYGPGKSSERGLSWVDGDSARLMVDLLPLDPPVTARRNPDEEEHIEN